MHMYKLKVQPQPPFIHGSHTHTPLSPLTSPTWPIDLRPPPSPATRGGVLGVSHVMELAEKDGCNAFFSRGWADHLASGPGTKRSQEKKHPSALPLSGKLLFEFLCVLLLLEVLEFIPLILHFNWICPPFSRSKPRKRIDHAPGGHVLCCF